MPAHRSRRRARIAALVSVVLAITGFQFFLAPPAAQANPGGTGLVIHEVYGGGGNTGATYLNDFVELYNPTASPISLSGKSLQYRAASTLTASANTYAFGAAASVPAGGYYLVQCASGGANGVPLPVTADATNCTLQMSGTNGQIYLANTTTGIAAQTNAAAPWTFDSQVIDFVGFGSATVFEGGGPTAAPSVTTSVSRNAGTHADTDVNSADFTASASMTPTAAGPSPFAVADITNRTGTVGQAIGGFTATATGGTSPYTFTDPGTTLPPGVTIAANGAVSGTPTTVGTYSVVITGTDSAAPTPATDTEDFTFTIDPAPVGVTPIADIQGTDTGTSPLAGTTKTTQGVVTAKFPDGGFNGFYLQTPGADTTPGASDAIFVFTPTFDDGTLTIGDSVEVTGAVSEFGTAPNTLTEITASSVTPVASLGTVVNNTTIPGSDCALGSCPTLAQLDTAKEEFEGELFQPSGPTTVTDAFDGSVTNPPNSGSSSFFGEIGLAANSTLPLLSQTEVAIPDSPAALDRIAFNNAHRLVLDDGSSTTYWNTANNAAGQNQTLPWYSVAVGQENQVRVGAAVTFPQPVVLDYRFGWKVQPTTMVVGKPTATQPQFQQDRPATPAAVGGDLKLATFNVLNYFTTLGVDYDALPTESCTSFPDREGNPIAVNSCTGNGPRGAWNTASFLRQQAKIVTAINTMDADVVSLEEIENSRKVDGVDRDEALSALVDALNAAAGTTRWAFVDSPATLPAVADEDVIRTGFIYDPSTVDLVGGAKVLINSAPFANAREPFAQAFKMEGAPNSQGFAVVVNHFKSKGGPGTGDNFDTGNGAGSFNGDRTRQAQALNTFATNFAASRGVTATFLTGDFNAYSKETPVTTLNSAGWVNLESTDDPQEESYSFDGMSGSLDHVFANAAAEDLVNGVDIWEINANETVFNQYSRYNYVTPLLFQSGPFSASDHNPEVIGINAPVEPATRDIQILGTNDFHGRLERDGAGPTAGAAVLSGAVKSLRVANPDTVFAAAGDLIGASTFASFIAHDKPTIDALNEAGLEVSAAGNHEFDQGYHDLLDRVMQPASPSNPEGGANWQYIAANLRLKAGGGHALMPTWTKDFGAVKVGFIGAVTEDLPTLVSPAGISELDVTSIVAETNTSANALEAAGADVIVLLVHEGAPSTDCATMANPGTAFASIINGVNANVDAIISGHTHLSYNCHFPVAAWAGRPVTERPVVSAGQYGMQLDKLVFTVDTATGQVQAMTQSLINLQSCTANCTPPATPVWSPNFTADPDVTSIVSAAVANAAVLGAVPLGQLGGPFFRGKLANGTTENRGAESTIGNLVAEVQKWATRNPESGSAQIAFMNPGGLRQDMTGTGTGAFPRTLTYQDAAIVQPFANTLVNMDLTGAQIKKVLEQQWNQPSSRPFLKLGISKGFTYTSVPPPAGSPAGTLGTVTGMWLNGTPIGLGTTYSVTVNSFLAAGGDGFLELANGVSKQDTGQTDLAAMVDYMDAFGSGGNTVNPWFQQNGVNVTFPPAAPAGYAPADHVLFSVAGWSMTNALDLKDTAVTVKLGATTLGTATLDNTPQSALPGFDVTGTANVDVVVPATQLPGPMTLTLVGATTGTESQVTVNVIQAGTTSVTANDVSVAYGQPAPIQVTVSGPGLTPTGTVDLKDGATTVATGTLDGTGKVVLTVPARTYPVGQVTLTAVYNGDVQHSASQTTLTLTTTKATSTTTAGDTTMAYGLSAAVTVNVVATAGVDVGGTVTVKNGATTLATAPVVGGVAHLTLPANSLQPGTASLTASYSGNANVNASDDTFTVTVSKASSTTEADIKPNHPTTKQKVKLTVKVTGANGVEATGKVKVIVDGETVTKTLDGGKLKLNLGKFSKGKHKVRVIYLGSPTVEGSATKVRFTVT